MRFIGTVMFFIFFCCFFVSVLVWISLISEEEGNRMAGQSILRKLVYQKMSWGFLMLGLFFVELEILVIFFKKPEAWEDLLVFIPSFFCLFISICYGGKLNTKEAQEFFEYRGDPDKLWY